MKTKNKKSFEFDRYSILKNKNFLNSQNYIRDKYGIYYYIVKQNLQIIFFGLLMFLLISLSVIFLYILSFFLIPELLILSGIIFPVFLLLIILIIRPYNIINYFLKKYQKVYYLKPKSIIKRDFHDFMFNRFGPEAYEYKGTKYILKKEYSDLVDKQYINLFKGSFLIIKK